MLFKTLSTVVLVAALLPLPGQAALLARSLDGDAATAEAYYDTELGITWMRDVNHLAQVSPGMVATGYTNWADADAAITAMNANAAASYGFSGWRMTRADAVHVIGGPGCQFGVNGTTDCGSNVDIVSSELAWMFHVNLGNLSSRDTSGNTRAGQAGIDFGLVSVADFLNLETGRYWSSTDSFRLIFNIPQNGKVTFDMADGSQGITVPTASAGGFTWLVHDGIIGTEVVAGPVAVAEPSSVAATGLALLALGAMQRRRARAAG